MEIEDEAEEPIRNPVEEQIEEQEEIEEHVQENPSFRTINIEPTSKKRKMSFDLPGRPQLEFMFDQNDEELGILGDPNTFRPSAALPHFSNANDDINIGRVRGDKERLMGFLYAGDVPTKHSSKNKKKKAFIDMPWGSDYTPEKDQSNQRNEMRSSLKIIDEEEKEFNEAIDEVKIHKINYGNIQSEQIYDNQNQLINEM